MGVVCDVEDDLLVFPMGDDFEASGVRGFGEAFEDGVVVHVVVEEVEGF